MDVIFGVITMRRRGISFHGPVKSGEAGGHRSKPKVVLALVQMLLQYWFVIVRNFKESTAFASVIIQIPDISQCLFTS